MTEGAREGKEKGILKAAYLIGSWVTSFRLPFPVVVVFFLSAIIYLVLVTMYC